jgi:hypothetical protein
MKIHSGFVTNSSSSFFVIIYKINLSDELVNFIKTEFGFRGLDKFTKALIKKDKAIEKIEQEVILNDNEKAFFDDNGNYIEWYEYSGEDCRCGPLNEMIEAIPDKFKEFAYEYEIFD